MPFLLQIYYFGSNKIVEVNELFVSFEFAYHVTRNRPTLVEIMPEVKVIPSYESLCWQCATNLLCSSSISMFLFCFLATYGGPITTLRGLIRCLVFKGTFWVTG